MLWKRISGIFFIPRESQIVFFPNPLSPLSIQVPSPFLRKRSRRDTYRGVYIAVVCLTVRVCLEESLVEENSCA